MMVLLKQRPQGSPRCFGDMDKKDIRFWNGGNRALHRSVYYTVHQICSTFGIDENMQRLYFLHIPKTAGTTLNALLDQHYSTDEILPKKLFKKNALHVTAEDFPEEQAKAFRSYKLIHGHFGGDILAQHLPGFRSMTILRDPVARVVSLYNDWRTKSDYSYEHAIEPARELIDIARKASIAEFLLCGHELADRQFKDGQARQLVSTLALHEPADAQAACDRLDSMDLVGTTEMLEPTIHLLTQMMGWAPIAGFASLNRSNGSVKADQLDSKTREIIHEFTQADQIVYRHAQMLLNRRLSDSLSNLISRQPTKLDSPMPRVEILAKDPIDGQGWHIREGDTEQWRWTGPERCSTLRVGLQPGHRYEVQIRIISVIAEDILAGTHLTLNGHSLYFENKGQVDGKIVLRAEIPSWMVNSLTESTLSILVPRTLSHAEIQPETNDHRQKGLAITSVCFGPVTGS